MVCSTGLIGERLPIDKLLAGVDVAVEALSPDGGPDAAVAIMTTDTVAKTAHMHVDGDRGAWTVGGMAKGAGMLAPGLATMLCVITTDAVVDAETADAALRAATAETFDRVDSDGCMSTSDTVTLLVSGASRAIPDPDGLHRRAHRRSAASSPARSSPTPRAPRHDIAVTVMGAETRGRRRSPSPGP